MVNPLGRPLVLAPWLLESTIPLPSSPPEAFAIWWHAWNRAVNADPHIACTIGGECPAHHHAPHARPQPQPGDDDA